jgi:hypothetical protein
VLAKAQGRNPVATGLAVLQMRLPRAWWQAKPFLTAVRDVDLDQPISVPRRPHLVSKDRREVRLSVVGLWYQTDMPTAREVVFGANS